MDEEAIAKQMIDRLADDLFQQICGNVKPNRPTMLRYCGGRFESVELDDFYQPIEPPARCPKCGPVLCCPDHMVIT